MGNGTPLPHHAKDGDLDNIALSGATIPDTEKDESDFDKEAIEKQEEIEEIAEKQDVEEDDDSSDGDLGSID